MSMIFVPATIFSTRSAMAKSSPAVCECMPDHDGRESVRDWQILDSELRQSAVGKGWICLFDTRPSGSLQVANLQQVCAITQRPRPVFYAGRGSPDPANGITWNPVRRALRQVEFARRASVCKYRG